MDLIDGVAKVSSIGWTKETRPDSINIPGINPKDRGIKIMVKKEIEIEIEIDNTKENEIEIETEITAIPRTSISKDICDDIYLHQFISKYAKLFNEGKNENEIFYLGANSRLLKN